MFKNFKEFLQEKDKSEEIENRPTALKRGYNYQWQKHSKEFLEKHPYCRRCETNGKKIKAELVDHITPHKGDEKLFWDRRNWRPLCRSCHSS